MPGIIAVIVVCVIMLVLGGIASLVQECCDDNSPWHNRMQEFKGFLAFCAIMGCVTTFFILLSV